MLKDPQYLCTYDTSLVVGADFSLTFEYDQPDGTTPLDLTGCSAVLKIRVPDADGLVILTATTADGTIAALGTDGRIVVHVPASTTTALNAHGRERGAYDLLLTMATGAVVPFAVGDVAIRRAVTR